MSKATPRRGEAPRFPRGDFYTDQIAYFSRATTAAPTPGDGGAVQQRLGRARALVIGARGVGSHALAALADAGLGRLHVLDAGRVDDRDVLANALLQSEDVGRGVAEATVARLELRNPYVACEVAGIDAASADQVTRLLPSVDCALVCLDGPAPLVLEAVNQAALRTGTPWMAGRVDRGLGFIGPTVYPHQNACYTCYLLRRNANLENYDELVAFESRLRELPTLRSGLVAPRPLATALGGLVALEALRLLSGLCTPQTAGRILKLDFLGPELTYHRLLRWPGCPACGVGRRGSAPG